VAGLDGARVVLGVSGGIAAYKAADVTSKLVQAGAEVDVILTAAATRFVGAPTFEALTQRPVHVDLFAPWHRGYTGHVSLGHEANILVVAPATANTIAKLANGLADDMLGAVALSTAAPLLVAPAMEHTMFHHPATQANIATLVDRGAVMLGPESGRLASGEMGDGRLASPETIVGTVRVVLGRKGPLAGRHVVISAGGTQEPIDPVRYIGNRSSGLMGYSLAQAAIDAGAKVTLVTTPTTLDPPIGAIVKRVVTAEEMQTAVEEATGSADILIMAAAVADFRPRTLSEMKIKKRDGVDTLELELIRNPDILGGVTRPGLLKIGFAAETHDLLEHAREKLERKSLAMIVANDAVSTIGAPTSTATLIKRSGETTALAGMEKPELAELIVREIARLASEPRGR
jgi:phosphopantothenoylcysteine decarboxylase/phosphopantothenate--cysteine ligase